MRLKTIDPSEQRAAFNNCQVQVIQSVDIVYRTRL